MLKHRFGDPSRKRHRGEGGSENETGKGVGNMDRRGRGMGGKSEE